MNFTQTLERIKSISEAPISGRCIVQSRKVMVMNSTPDKVRKASIIWRLRSEGFGTYQIVCRADGQGFAHITVAALGNAGKLREFRLDDLAEGLEVSENSLTFSLDLTKI